MRYTFPKPIEDLFSIFQSYQYTAYLVGGCVRDYLLQREINDYDMATSATPSQLLTLCEKEDIKYIPTGIQHGTVTLVYQHYHVEVTTFRKEGVYHHHRAPIDVYYTNDIQEDAKRRDFTINALYMNKHEILDFYNGKQHIEEGLICSVNDPNERFEEDALRILRCLRFACTLGFTIEEKTYQALIHTKHLLQAISKERIRDEFNKILLSNSKDCLLLLKESGILPYLIEEFTLTYDVPQETPYHCFDVFHHINSVLNHSQEATLSQKLALLLHDIQKKNYKTIDEKGVAHFKGHAHASAILAKQILYRLKYDHKTIQLVYHLIYYHDYYVTPKEKVLRKFMYKLKGDFTLAYQILYVQSIDNLGKHPNVIQELNYNIEQSITVLKQIEARRECFALQDLQLSGKDIEALGIQGKQVGDLLDKALYYVVQNQDKNKKEILLQYIGGMIYETTNH